VSDNLSTYSEGAEESLMFTFVIGMVDIQPQELTQVYSCLVSVLSNLIIIQCFLVCQILIAVT